MNNFIKQNWIIIIIILCVGWILLNNNIFAKEEWQAVYYPDGCLACENNYIFSPFFDNKNDCINWIYAKQKERNNNNDTAECALNCKKDYNLGGILVCKETLDVLGKPSY